jgi:hypothetical protein
MKRNVPTGSAAFIHLHALPEIILLKFDIKNSYSPRPT